MKGEFINCRNELITGLSLDGGYAEYLYGDQASSSS